MMFYNGFLEDINGFLGSYSGSHVFLVVFLGCFSRF